MRWQSCIWKQKISADRENVVLALNNSDISLTPIINNSLNSSWIQPEVIGSGLLTTAVALQSQISMWRPKSVDNVYNITFTQHVNDTGWGTWTCLGVCACMTLLCVTHDSFPHRWLACRMPSTSSCWHMSSFQSSWTCLKRQESFTSFYCALIYTSIMCKWWCLHLQYVPVKMGMVGKWVSQWSWMDIMSLVRSKYVQKCYW